MKYRVQIPPPKTKRMLSFPKRLTVEIMDGWSVYKTNEYTVSAEQTEFEFEIGDDVRWVYDTTELDGLIFKVVVEYTNKTGSRTETYNLIPEVI